MQWICSLFLLEIFSYQFVSGTSRFLNFDSLSYVIYSPTYDQIALTVQKWGMTKKRLTNGVSIENLPLFIIYLWWKGCTHSKRILICIIFKYMYTEMRSQYTYFFVIQDGKNILTRNRLVGYQFGIRYSILEYSWHPLSYMIST